MYIGDPPTVALHLVGFVDIAVDISTMTDDRPLNGWMNWWMNKWPPNTTSSLMLTCNLQNPFAGHLEGFCQHPDPSI